MKNNKGFSLTETLVTMLILSVVMVACLGLIASALSAKNKSSEAIAEHVALRQTVLVITREIRKAPALINTISGDLYVDADNQLRMRADGSVVARDIGEFYIEIEDDRAIINIESTSGQKVKTAIYLRGRI